MYEMRADDDGEDTSSYEEGELENETLQGNGNTHGLECRTS